MKGSPEVTRRPLMISRGPRDMHRETNAIRICGDAAAQPESFPADIAVEY
jgi:hypothetical protein